MNIININQNEYNEKVLGYLKAMSDVEYYMRKLVNTAEILNQHGFIFNSFRLYCNDEKGNKKILYKVEIDNDVIHMKMIDLIVNKKVDEYICDYLDMVKTFTDELMDRVNRGRNDREDRKWILHFGFLMNVLSYITLKGSEEPEMIFVEQTDRRYTEKKSSKKTSTDMVYSLEQCVRKYTRHINHCKHVITCEHWEVRGHYRHLKSGKTVYVKPFEKGKNRNSGLKDKVYKL